ncbi:MAG: hypothetical protein FJY92_03905, partial [Candidatus Hydrogenedentes bacterium]|nr:hypothetical protein [Candidatus Hydrogenedentota bacterium]
MFGYYSHGWRGRNAQGEIVFAVQTPNYALLMNASKARIERSGTVRSGTDAAVAVRQDNQSVLDRLSATPLTFQVRAGGIVYDAVAAAPAPDAVLIQRLGKYLAHVEVRGVTLRAPDAPLLEGANASIHLYAWPDHARVTFQLDSAVGLDDVTLTARYAARAGRKALRAVNLVSEVQRDRIDGNTTIVEHTVPAIAAGAGASLTVGLSPRAAAPAGGGDACVIRATGIAPYTGELAVFQDPVAGWRQVMLGENADIWTAERVRLELENPGDAARTVHLAFSKRGGGFGITGMSPVLCDEFGAPLGLPVQISKNWHVRPPWFDAVTMVDLAPRATRRIEFRLAYADWGGAPAVSHAQLALEGWGTHQLWDECAIGSFGESITYDPDVNLGRAMIDDVRPLMVWGMGAGPQRKWSWTHNVGGGDLLVLEQDGKRQYVVRQKTHYESQGPVLTNVQYAGETP